MIDLWESRKKTLNTTSKESLLECWKHCSDGWLDCSGELEESDGKLKRAKDDLVEIYRALPANADSGAVAVSRLCIRQLLKRLGD